MYKYILQRLLLLIPVIIGVSLLVYAIMDIAEGDPVYQIVSENASQEVIEATREAYGLNDPFLVRYARYMFNLCRGDMGASYITKQDVFASYMALLPNTIKLSVLSVVIAVIVSIPLGINAAIHQNTWADTGSMITSLVFVSMPQFWLGLLLIIAFALNLKWFPSGGNEDGFRSLVLPAFTVGIGLAALMTRTTRSSMLETIRQDYITTAKAKGVSNRVTIYHHAFKKRPDPHRDHCGHAVRPDPGGQRADRDRLLLPRRWAADRAVHRPAGHPHGYRLADSDHHPGQLCQPGHRHRVRVHRSPDQVAIRESKVRCSYGKYHDIPGGLRRPGAAVQAPQHAPGDLAAVQEEQGRGGGPVHAHRPVRDGRRGGFHL